MADTGGIRAGRAYVELGTSDKLAAGLRRAQRQLQAFGGAVRNIGLGLTGVSAGVLAPLAASAKTFANAGDTLDKMSKRTGVSVEALSELGFAAEQSGGDLETLESALRIMQRNVSEAAQGTKTAVDAFHALGLSVRGVAALTPERQFKLVADQLSKIKDPTRRAAAAMDVFGKSGTRLLPMLTDGAKGIEALQAQARDFKLTLSTDAADKAAVLTDSLNILRRTVQQVAVAAGEALAPSIADVARRSVRTVAAVVGWVRTNRQLVVGAAKAAVVVGAAGIAITGAGVAIAGFGAVLGGLASIVTAAQVAVGALATAVGAILSPVGLAIGAVVALGSTVAVQSSVAGAALDWLRGQFKQLHAFVFDVVGGIADALAAGDIGLAAKVMWLGLKAAWEEGSATLQRVWLGLQRTLREQWQIAWTGIRAVHETAVDAVTRGMLAIVNAGQTAWAKLSAFVSDQLDRIVNLATKAWNSIKGAFDDGFNVAAANTAADLALAASLNKTKAATDAELARLKQLREAQRKELDAEHVDAIRKIVAEDEAGMAAIAAEFEARKASTSAALEAAKQELAAALADAKRKRDALDVGGDVPRGVGADPLAGLEDRLLGLGDTVAQKLSVTGTFNAIAAGGLGTGSTAAERTAQATEALVGIDKKVLAALQYGAARFA